MRADLLSASGLPVRDGAEEGSAMAALIGWGRLPSPAAALVPRQRLLGDTDRVDNESG